MKKLSFIIAAAQFAFVFFSDLAVAKTIKSAPVKIVVAGATVTESGMPAWRQGQAVGEWRQIPNSALSNVPISVNTYPTLGNTGPSSKVGAWCGFGIDTRDSSIYSAANGGHNDYAGNEVDRIRLSDDAPAWKEVKASTPAEQVVARQDHYADGRPTSRHSYYGAFVNEVRDRVMIIGGSGWGAPLTHSIDAFSLALNDWDSANSFPNISADALRPQAQGNL